MIEIFNLIASDEPAWQANVGSHPDATIYHTLAWRDILYNEYKFEPAYLIAKEGSRVVGILPMFLVNNLRGRRLVSLPFSIYGGPLGETKAVVSLLLNKAIEMVKEEKAGSLEVKPYSQMDIDLPELAYWDCGISTTVDLTVGEGKLWEGLTDKNDVNRAIKEGLTFSLSDGEGIEGFYRLQLMTRKRIGLPTPSLRYYKSFFEKMPGLVKLGLVEKENVPIAGGVFFVYKNDILYALGASDHRYLSSKPNDLLIWEMVKWGSENGFKVFDLGPTPLSNKGLTHFKAKWGGRTTPVNEHVFPCRNEEHKKVNKMASSLFEVLPVNLARHVGHHVIRVMG